MLAMHEKAAGGGLDYQCASEETAVFIPSANPPDPSKNRKISELKRGNRNNPTAILRFPLPSLPTHARRKPAQKICPKAV